jgi:hypothetical protein
MADSANAVPTVVAVLHEVAAICGGLAWPAIALFVLLRYRGWIATFLPVVTDKVRNASSLEVPGVKLTVAKDLVEAAISQPSVTIPAERSVPQEQVRNAEALRAQLQSAGIAPSTIIASVRDQIIRFSTEYETIRSFMPSSPERTVEMNRIMGGLRTLGLAAKPLLPQLTVSARPGERLAAIAVLQTEPDIIYLQWLVERFSLEQPFVFYHAALALRQAALAQAFGDRQRLKDGINTALAKVEAFTGGRPDQNSIMVLRDALAVMDKK